MSIFTVKLFALLAVLWSTTMQTGAQPRISIFYDHVAEIARQEGISNTEAARRVKELGVEGIDVRVTMRETQLNMLDSLGFQHASAIADINFIQDEQPEAVRQAIDFMHRYHYSRLLIVPGLLPENASQELIAEVCSRINAFVKKARKEGVDVMVEDFDNPRSPCYNTPALDRLFAASPQLNHVFDTGNYLFCGEDVMKALRHFRKRIQHVHLKDRKAQHDRASLPIGAGIVPLKEVVSELLRSGYKGWFTIEHFGAPSMLEYATQSVANVKAAWEEAGLSASAHEKPFVVPAVENWKAGKGELQWNQLTSISYNDAILQGHARYLSGFTGNIPATLGKGGSVNLQLCTDKKLGNEGYLLTITPKGVTIKAQTEQGVLWGIQTLQQLHEQGKPLPCGTITDTPAYAIRGTMVDVGRKFIPLSYLYSLVDLMSYYKMNTLQVHLNDCGSNDYYEGNWDKTYAAFRMESELFPELTAKDGYYTKKGFHDFILYAKSMGVEIIPEIDTPSHSLCFSHYRPSLASEEFGHNHLDLRNPAVTPFLDSLYAEYLGGPDPVFCCPRMHIGVDEYSNKDKAVVELFRGLVDHLIREVERYGKQAVFWGQLTHAKGNTPVKVENVMMEMWYNGYANPRDMHDLGYQMITVPSRQVYIVPAAGYYFDYLNCKNLYEKWTPANIAGEMFPERDPQIHGGMFCVWNDICYNGISVGDIHHRIFPAVQIISEKTWHAVNDTIGYAKWDRQRKALGEGYTCNQLGNTQTVLPVLPSRSIINQSEDAQIGYDYQVEFDIAWATEPEGTVLLQTPYSRFYLSDPIGGWLGFTRDGYLYTFRHKGKPGRKEHICIKGTNRSTSLFVNGKLVQELGIEKQFYAKDKTYNYVQTLVFPLHETGRFNSEITQFKALKQ